MAYSWRGALAATIVLASAGCGTDEGSGCDRSSDCAADLSCVGDMCVVECTFLYSCSSSDELCIEGQCARSLTSSECDVFCTDADDVCVEGGLCCDVGDSSARCAPGCTTEGCAQDCADGSCCGDGTCEYDMGESIDVCPEECAQVCEQNEECPPEASNCVLETFDGTRGICAADCRHGDFCRDGVCFDDVCEPGTPGDECLVECNTPEEFCIGGYRCCSTDLGNVSCSLGCNTTADCERLRPGTSCTGDGSFRPSCRAACGALDPCFSASEGCLAESCVPFEDGAACAPTCAAGQVCVDGTRCCELVDGALTCP